MDFVDWLYISVAALAIISIVINQCIKLSKVSVMGEKLETFNKYVKSLLKLPQTESTSRETPAGNQNLQEIFVIANTSRTESEVPASTRSLQTETVHSRNDSPPAYCEIAEEESPPPYNVVQHSWRLIVMIIQNFIVIKYFMSTKKTDFQATNFSQSISIMGGNWMKARNTLFRLSL